MIKQLEGKKIYRNFYAIEYISKLVVKRNNSSITPNKKRESLDLSKNSLLVKRRLPTLPRVCSTIGVTRLNFSVRNGKRWNPCAIAT